MGKRKSPNLRIGIIHPDLGIGGAERLIVDAALELASHGHNVHVFTAHHDRNRCFEETLSGSFQVKVYGSFLPRHIFHRFHAVCAYIRCIFVAFCMLFLGERFDVIIADQVSVVIPILRLKKSTKIVFYCHFPDMLLARHSTLLRRLYRKPIDMIEELTTGLSDLILVNSRFTASTFANTFRSLHSRGIVPEILYPAVDIAQFDGPCSYKMNFLSLNRFERKKNVALAISAFAMLRNNVDGSSGFDFSKLTLTIAGGFDPRLPENVENLEELKRLAETEGVSDQIRFFTSCSTATRNSLLSECMCVIYTPKDEHFGIVPLEAMAARKPVIACNCGGPVETIKDGVTGFLCSPSSVEFSRAMFKLVSNPALSANMGEAARDHVSRSFSRKVFGKRLNRYINDVYDTGK
ncbi:UDP-Glycosyltransferase superfamily protein isoform X2 [Wolffia australiana]